MSSFLDPDVLSRIEGLRLLPRIAQTSTIAGSRLTPQLRGSSMEFVDYKSYAPGDDPRRIDWKVYGRRDRYYLRSYEGETNCTLWLVLDASRSMRYQSPGGAPDKWSFSCRMALALAYLALKSRDACGMVIFADGLIEFLEPKASWEMLSRFVATLENFDAFGSRTAYRKSFWSLTEQIPRRSLIAVFSDFLGDEPEIVVQALEAMALERHEVLAMRVLDPSEEDLSRMEDGNARVVSLEEGEGAPMEVELGQLRDLYKARFQAEERFFATRLSKRSIEYEVFHTNGNPGDLLANYLARRSPLA